MIVRWSRPGDQGLSALLPEHIDKQAHLRYSVQSEPYRPFQAKGEMQTMRERETEIARKRKRQKENLKLKRKTAIAAAAAKKGK